MTPRQVDEMPLLGFQAIILTALLSPTQSVFALFTTTSRAIVLTAGGKAWRQASTHN
jgi:hypothetical protein